MAGIKGQMYVKVSQKMEIMTVLKDVLNIY